MRRFRVTIGDWSTEVEAESNAKAMRVGAKIFRKEVSDKIPLSGLWTLARVKALEDFRIKSATFNVGGIPVADKQHFVGLWEGDGSAGLDDGKYPRLILYQKSPILLEYVRRVFSLEEKVACREVTSKPPGAKKLHTAVYSSLVVTRKAHVYPLLDVIRMYVVSPSRVEQLNRLFGPGFEEHQPTWPWLGGFIDAEGCISFGGGLPGLWITQKDEAVLGKIHAFVGFGSLQRDKGFGTTLAWNGSKAFAVASKVLPYIRNRDKSYPLYALYVLKEGDIK